MPASRDHGHLTIPTNYTEHVISEANESVGKDEPLASPFQSSWLQTIPSVRKIDDSPRPMNGEDDHDEYWRRWLPANRAIIR